MINSHSPDHKQEVLKQQQKQKPYLYRCAYSNLYITNYHEALHTPKTPRKKKIIDLSATIKHEASSNPPWIA